ncbi:hypothetical protein J2857_005018 [Neorhizobium galegae]|uniref:hypothetical protein n=1 Tax=Neorhizobium galegae TaxID=399 RepID=UPI001AE1E815|nr:hypothetical protein [Neorhizobium galegae]MBP2562227.1 hypothetical protein [Neorhizobium galegae]
MIVNEGCQLVVIDERLSKGLVRAETRGLTDALKQHTGEVLRTFHERVMAHFEKQSRLTLPEMQAMAVDLHNSAKTAFNPLWCDLEISAPTRGRPQSGDYEMLHYWINPKHVEGTANRLMMIAMFSAWGSRKQASMRAHDTLTSFYEHAAHRLLQRCGSNEAAVRAIGERLVETIIIPTLALHDAPSSLIETELAIPFMDGLLIGRFVRRSPDTIAGDHKIISKAGWRTRPITFGALAEFVVKTYIGPNEMTDRQERIAYQVESWLDIHRKEAETIRRYITYKLGALWDSGHMRRDEFDALAADYRRMHERVFMPGSSLPIGSSFR